MYDVICSGTGPSFFSMLGVCRALIESDIKVANVACTSGSSIPLSLVYGADIDWFDVYNELMELDFGSMLKLRPWRGGFYDTHLIEDWINARTSSLTLGESKVPFALNTVDIQKKRMHVMTTENQPAITFGKAIRMTISIPILFAPVEYKNKWFVDGGVYRNVQTDAFPNSGNPKLVFVEHDLGQDEVGEIWEKEGNNSCPSIKSIAMNSIACLLKSRYEYVADHLPPNSRLIPIKVHDTSDLTPSKSIRTRLFKEGFEQAMEPLQSLGG